jgi:hypothetical protein
MKKLLNSQFSPAFCAAAGKDAAAGRRGLAHQKPVGGFAFFLFGAIGERHSLDDTTPFLKSKMVWAAR